MRPRRAEALGLTLWSGPEVAAGLLAIGAAVLSLSFTATAQGTTSAATKPDPRATLSAGWLDAGSTARSLRLMAHRDKPAGFFNPKRPGDFAFANTDLAFSGQFVFQGGANGIQIWDISAPAAPTLRTTITCPGGQGDVSVHANLLFMSVEEPRARIDCGGSGTRDTVSVERFRGVRIFDISDIDHPRQVAAVQTCRGSHTHTLLTNPHDTTSVYVYVSGTSFTRPNAELAGCSRGARVSLGRARAALNAFATKLPDGLTAAVKAARAAPDPGTSGFSIEIIKVPLASPAMAKIVDTPRIFADSAGNIASLWPGGSHGDGTQTTSITAQCHDITAYQEIGLAAGACSGNGILLDIRDPARPRRVEQVLDPNFAYWHSAIFSNAGDKVVFSDEWGGGWQPRCQASDRREWGATAVFSLKNEKLRREAYYKLPAVQTAKENCVAHNGGLVPIPGRDIMVQAWYQGGISVFDFTDPSRPHEIAYFDRGPMSDSLLVFGGYWSAYWYNGLIIGSEIGRGLDILELTPGPDLSRNEIAAAKLVHFSRLNPQQQHQFVWPTSFVVARAYADQLGRSRSFDDRWKTRLEADLDAAEQMRGARRAAVLRRLATTLDSTTNASADSNRVKALATILRELAAQSP